MDKIDLETAAWLEGYPDGPAFLKNDPVRAGEYLGRIDNVSGELAVRSTEGE